MSYLRPCPGWEEKLGMSEEVLTPAECAARDAHITVCSGCAATWADYQFLATQLSALPAPAMKPLPRLSSLLQIQEEGQKSSQHEEYAAYRYAQTMTTRQSSAKSSPRLVRVLSRVVAVGLVACLVLFALHVFSMRTMTTTGSSLSTPLGKTLFLDDSHHAYVNALAWSPNGKYLASAGADDIVQVWDVQNIQNPQLITTYRGHHGEVVALAWSHDSAYLASGSWDHTVQVWHALDGKWVNTLQPTTSQVIDNDVVTSLAWSFDDMRIAAGNGNNWIYVWDVQSGQLTAQFNGHATGYPCSLAWSPKGNFIASGGHDDTVQIWDTNTSDPATLVYRGHSESVCAVAWSSDGKEIVSGSWDHTVKVWNAFTGETLLTYANHTAGVNAVAWSPDGRSIASAGSDTTVQIWDAHTGATRYTYRGHLDAVNALSWSPDGKFIASASDDHTVQIWVTG